MTEPIAPPEVETSAQSSFAADLIKRDDLWSRPGNHWPLDAGFAAELDRWLSVRQPRSIVEVGSGSSTLILGRYARATGAKVISLEHDSKWAEHTLAELALEGTAEYVDLRLRNLIMFNGTDAPWYQNDGIPAGVDFVLIDGPPQRLGGRLATLPALWPYLAEGWCALLDDADRDGEGNALLAWAAMLGVSIESLPFGKNGAALITPDGVQRHIPHVDASDVCLTILTGQRPDRLAELLDSLETYAPGLLDTAQVVALHNGGADGDEHTRELLQYVGASLITTTSVYGIGRATSLLERSSRQSGAAYWLHLEDDWRITSMATGWLDQARELLPRRPRFAQVRLRHVSEPTLTRNMVTGRQFSWAGSGESAVPHLHSYGAHLTFNPFLTRTGTLTPAFPAASEREFMANAGPLGLTVSAQLYPGVFAHTGGGDRSLRAKTGGA